MGDAQNVRRGLVLGAGGVLGGSWMIAGLRVLHQRLGWDPRDAEVVVGTSAGAVLSILLASGVSTSDLVDDQYGRETKGPLSGSGLDHDTALGGPFTLPRPGLGSLELLAHSLRHPLQQSPLAWCAALCSPGTGSLRKLRELVEHVVPDDSGQTVRGWSSRITAGAIGWFSRTRVLRL